MRTKWLIGGVIALIAVVIGVTLGVLFFGEKEPEEEPDNDVTVVYAVEGGGYIDGEAEQTVLLGESTAPVYAEANDGWVFVGWSDGYDNPYRTGDTVDKDTVITAYFEEIGEIEDGERPPSESEYGEPSAPDLGVSDK